jgi:NADPH:quinone reductase-like Zn-dependent oxidoreductase
MTTATLFRPDAMTKPQTMQAIRVHAFGGPEVLSLETIACPHPGSGEVLVRIKAAGVGPWDGWVRGGKSVIPQPLPLTPGSDLAGVVEAVGADVGDFAVGEAVYGVTNPRFTDAYAEYAIAKATMISGKPETLSFVEAASVPVIAVTAWQALFEHARVQPGQTILIHGAAGSVGAFAVQMAKLAEMRVIATAGSDDLDYVRSLGAERAIDYRAGRFDEQIQGVDAVIDLVGGETQARSCSVLKPGGYLISAVSQPDPDLAELHRVHARFFLVDVTTMDLTRVAEMIDAGELKTRVGLVMPLTDARIAHEMLEGMRSAPSGKIILKVTD